MTRIVQDRQGRARLGAARLGRLGWDRDGVAGIGVDGTGSWRTGRPGLARTGVERRGMARVLPLYLAEHMVRSRFYVYVIFASQLPVYVGKGTGSRCMDHMDRSDFRAFKSLRIEVEYCKSEEAALHREADLINALWGGGTLLNKICPPHPSQPAQSTRRPPSRDDRLRTWIKSTVPDGQWFTAGGLAALGAAIGKSVTYERLDRLLAIGAVAVAGTVGRSRAYTVVADVAEESYRCPVTNPRT